MISAAKLFSQTPPQAPQHPHQITQCSATRNDPFFWLRDRSNPDTLTYLKAENRYAETVMKPVAGLEHKLYQEMRGRIQETDSTVPYQVDQYLYYNRTETGKQYPIYCRRLAEGPGEEEVLLDGNAMAQGQGYFRIGVLAVSRDQHLLAYSTDTTGQEKFLLRIKDLDTGKLLPDRIQNTATSVAWTNDGRELFYLQLDSANRPYRVYRHVLGQDSSKDELLFEEKDARFELGLRKSRSRRFIFLESESETTSEVRFLEADEPNADFRIVSPRRDNVLYQIDDSGDRFFIVTNDQAENFKIVTAPVSDPGRDHWVDFVPYDAGEPVDALEAFADYVAVLVRKDGLPAVKIYDLPRTERHADIPTGKTSAPLDTEGRASPRFGRLVAGKDPRAPAPGAEQHDPPVSRYVDLNQPTYDVDFGDNPTFDADKLRLEFSSLVTPPTIVDVNIHTGAKTLLKQAPVLGGFEPSNYREERIFATAADGTRIPVSLFYRQGLAKDGSAPILLEGYGAYGLTEDADFSSSRLALADRGFVLALAHIRGGGEYGHTWYHAGKLLKKKNTFTDFIACAEELIREKYGSSRKLVITGGSAGGLLMGAVMNLRPELFATVVADVPFVDVLNTMSDPSLPLTVTEYEEWGNPNDPIYFDYIRSYSPYDNLADKPYPNLYVTAGLNDSRVSYWEPAKWVAKQRTLSHKDRLLVLRTNMDAGHMGQSGRFNRLKELAMEYAFVLKTLGMDQ
ncbi:MAG: S9 family peptidase [Verrucomicrobia bacterium]|nr:S9 family peptidase [Verrucomicrobiota bacterium]